MDKRSKDATRTLKGPHSMETRTRRFRCTQCQKSFTSKFGLKRHLVYHLGRKLFLCNKCKETFTDLTRFLHHQRSHRSEGNGVADNHDEQEEEEKDSATAVGEQATITTQTAHHEITELHGLHPASMVAVMSHPSRDATASTSSRVLQHPLQMSSIATLQGSNQRHYPITTPSPGETNHACSSSPAASHPLLVNGIGGSSSENAERNDSATASTSNIALELPPEVPSICISRSLPRSEPNEVFLHQLNDKLDAIMKHFNIPLPTATVSATQPTPSTQTHPERHPLQNVLRRPNIPSPRTQRATPLNTPIADAKPPQTTPSSCDSDMTSDHSNVAATPTTPPMTELTCTHDKPHHVLTDSILEKIYLKSLNRGNFSKNLVYAIFSPEERNGRNCFGRRCSASGTKKLPLDPCRMKAIKDITFSKYPCDSWEMEVVWRRECVVAIDTAMRGEFRLKLRNGTDAMDPSQTEL